MQIHAWVRQTKVSQSLLICLCWHHCACNLYDIPVPCWEEE